MRFHRTCVFAIVMMAGLQSACQTDKPQPQVESSEHKFVVRMTDEMRFVPDNITAAVGDTIVWVNEGNIPHTSTDRPGAAGVPEHNILPVGAEPWDSEYVNAGETYSVILKSPGEYAYLCVIHETAGMIGHITIEGE